MKHHFQFKQWMFFTDFFVIIAIVLYFGAFNALPCEIAHESTWCTAQSLITGEAAWTLNTWIALFIALVAVPFLLSKGIMKALEKTKWVSSAR